MMQCELPWHRELSAGDQLRPELLGFLQRSPLGALVARLLDRDAVDEDDPLAPARKADPTGGGIG